MAPSCTVEFPKPDLLDVTLEDSEAKAWRVIVTGTGTVRLTGSRSWSRPVTSGP